MGFYIQLASYFLWLPLKVLAISAILRAGVRRYPLIFTYMIVTFFFTVAQGPVSLAYQKSHGSQGEWFQMLHSVAEGVTDILILAVVISFIYRATSRVHPRRLMRLALIAVGLLFMGVSLLVHYDSKVALGIWITPWTRDLDFCAAVLDLAVWALLIGSRERDPFLLLLTGGMGMMFVGEAIGAALRSISIPYRSYPVFLSGHIIMVLTEAAYLYVWWQAFRKEAAKESAKSCAAHVLLGDS